MDSYQVLESERSYSGRIIDVVIDRITLPDGRSVKREVVEHVEASVIIPVTPEGRLIFVRQYRHPAKGLVLELPAGTFNHDENPLVCAERELEEETGMKAGKISFLTKMYPSIGYCSEILHFFLATELRPGVQNLDEDEFITVEEYSLETAVEKIFNGEIVDGKTMLGILLYKETLRSH